MMSNYGESHLEIEEANAISGLCGIDVTKKKKISLATLLTGLVSLSVALTLTILLLASYHSNKQSLFDTRFALNHSTAAKMSQSVDSLFKSMRAGLKYTGAYISVNHLSNEQELHKQLELLRLSGNFFNSIAVVDETGLVRSVAPSSVGTVGQHIATEATKEALASRKPYISKPYISATGRLIVFMSEPLYDKDGVYRGFIGGSLYLQENNILNMMFGKHNVDSDGSYFYVVSSNGHLLFHPDKSRIDADISTNPAVQKVLRGESGYDEVTNSQGITFLAGYSPVPENGWGVIVQSPISVVYAELDRYIRTILFYTLAPFVVLMITAIWLARRLASPFVSLANLAGKLGRGERIVLPDIKHHWNREADLLTQTITLALNDLQKQTDQLTQAAMTDSLTGLTNRRTFESIMTQWTEKQQPFALIMMDIDRFKSINDTYGHQAGDEVLKHLARILTSSVRSNDVCCRYGGEEFVVLLPYTSAPEALITAERVRTAFETRENPLGIPLTVSSGIAHYPSHAESAEMLFQRADHALYQAKEAGKNRTIVAD
ncbi:sensor domain-containing diguanylate cyclase [Paenibacillus ehimensis]|uniref:Sensor domain-containing diguanylate cyclase n=1 Tax=Paenibacillus ehimensis TaxID=79264 RepID=A0ABT8VH01_9BACL|nr:sensor domain-containing diguanylate cyclase [Paenibacillus ehimensis]MDO3680243.1 sensor domain-containing diguanylate cyclase [Paenibacillus ehimensis]